MIQISQNFPREHTPDMRWTCQKVHFLWKSTCKRSTFSKNACKKVHYLPENMQKSPLSPEKPPPPNPDLATGLSTVYIFVKKWSKTLIQLIIIEVAYQLTPQQLALSNITSTCLLQIQI